MEERGRGVDSFVLNNFVADFCLHYNTPRSILTTPENTITYHNALCFSWELKWDEEKLKTMHMQNFGVTNKEHYGMLVWFFWSGQYS